mmetsp:Transcript_19821/g.23778  ORF Transcript_19821/g.23778 Transcript_19821/m.23778 type:complete len:236 (+) Transcript_19821:226-933(+)|eukprot:CAMPEP_0197854656 /NCGR_PEP_ID=MMETSP1438-20131217/25069_1 /TAXON_ID=1461541 /ORGANISM="Pterosperma sp., Strain CCMP1384" /LENGTH=235 /DNA_ID=CAMNT_0043469477 /DNA_START=220 /DNA_END=927 /DNA_ORIENTATION=+
MIALRTSTSASSRSERVPRLTTPCSENASRGTLRPRPTPTRVTPKSLNINCKPRDLIVASNASLMVRRGKCTGHAERQAICDDYNREPITSAMHATSSSLPPTTTPEVHSEIHHTYATPANSEETHLPLGTPAAASLAACLTVVAVSLFTAAPAVAGGLEGLKTWTDTGSTADLSKVQSFILVAGPLLLAPGLVTVPLLLTGIAKSRIKDKVYQSTASGIAAWFTAVMAVSLVGV